MSGGKTQKGTEKKNNKNHPRGRVKNRCGATA
jgi:hypothetical protein